MKIRIAQCLCPARHCIFGFGLAPETADPQHADFTSDEEAVLMLREAVGAMLAGRGDLLGLDEKLKTPMNDWCGLCGASSQLWQYEVARSREFKDWAEALDILKEMEMSQAMTSVIMNKLGLSYDAKRKRRMN